MWRLMFPVLELSVCGSLAPLQGCSQVAVSAVIHYCTTPLLFICGSLTPVQDSSQGAREHCYCIVESA